VSRLLNARERKWDDSAYSPLPAKSSSPNVSC
jgi:hypothetical protein